MIISKQHAQRLIRKGAAASFAQTLASHRRYWQLRRRLSAINRMYFVHCDQGREAQHRRVVSALHAELRAFSGILG